MNGKSMGMLALAVVFGLGAMYGTNKLISKDKGVAVVEEQDVLVAAKDLKIEELIKPDTVKVIRMNKSAVPPGAFTSIKDVEDRWVQIGILEGEPLVDKKLATRGTPPGLISRIPKGMRAFAIEVNEQSGVSGFVLPGHRVDVVKIEPGETGHPEAETVLQDVQVLASGVVFTRPDDRSIQARTVTVAVTPEQVDALVGAKSRGALTLSLRGLNDHTQAPPRPKPEPLPPPPPPPPPPPVAVVRQDPPKPAPATEPPPIGEPKMLLLVEPQVEPDGVGRLTYDRPPSALGVLVKPTNRVKSVTWQLDDSTPTPMAGNSRPNTAEDEAFWSSEVPADDPADLWKPGAHRITVRLETDEAKPQTFTIRQVILVKVPPQFVWIYRGNSSRPEPVRLFKSLQEMVEAGNQSRADTKADRKSFYDSIAKAAADSARDRGASYDPPR